MVEKGVPNFSRRLINVLFFGIEIEAEGREVNSVLQKGGVRVQALDFLLETLQAVEVLELVLSHLVSSLPRRSGQSVSCFINDYLAIIVPALKRQICVHI